MITIFPNYEKKEVNVKLYPLISRPVMYGHSYMVKVLKDFSTKERRVKTNKEFLISNL